jgi:hypothetical protein
MRALISHVYTRWWPHLLVDDHTTDGADFRHDLTYAYNHGPGVPTAIDHWLGEAFDPELAGYWGSSDLDEAARTVLRLIGRAYNKAKKRVLRMFAPGFEPHSCRSGCIGGGLSMTPVPLPTLSLVTHARRPAVA